MKHIIARLKETPTVSASVDPDFAKDWIVASVMVEETKRRLLCDLKTALHEKVAMLSMDDVEFKPLEEKK